MLVKTFYGTFIFSGDYMSIAIIGGDRRQIYLKNKLINDGYAVVSYFLEKDDTENIKNHGIYILPIPSLKDGFIFTPFYNGKISLSDIKPLLDNADTVICAKLNGYTDILKRDDFAYYNAVPTAEGTVAHIINNTVYTLYGKNVLVTGFGKVAEITVSRLCAFGCKISATFRRPEVCAKIEALKYDAINITDLPQRINEFDIIINTVEAPIFGKDLLSLCKKDAYICELASGCKGVDIDFAKSIGLNAHYLPALPGKTAPETAGEILYKTVKNILKEQSEG